MTLLTIGLFGGGTVGGGVYEMIQKNSPTNQMKITKICVRDLTKARSFTVDESVTTLTDDVDSILNDESINCIVEVMGGTGVAKHVVETALRNGKAVITANKALLAEHWNELQDILKANPAASLAWEAAVCGGIPIIQILNTCYVAEVDPIQSVVGIMNGTTNFMLTQMFDKGADYNDVLKQAQELGYAEADPTADVEGHDVRAKIALLAQLALGGTILTNNPTVIEQIPCQGISKITANDFGYARSLNATIKLTGNARRLKRESESGTEVVAVYVTPAVIRQGHPLASCIGVGNAVLVESPNLGSCSYMGPGAGRYPTANSVVADLYRLVNSNKSAATESSTSAATTTTTTLDSNYMASFYIRVPVAATSNAVGIVGTTGTLAQQHGVTIRSILKNSDQDFCILTQECGQNQVAAFCTALAAQPDLVTTGETPIFMPILGTQ